MDKFIIKWSHRLGVLALSLALVIRAIDIVNPRFSVIPTGGDKIGYLAFMHAALLFFITTIATTCYVWADAQNTRATSSVPAAKTERTYSKSIAQETA